MYRPLRTLWGLAAIGGATAVGLTTHDAGFVVITFLGGLALPRILGLRGPGMFRRGLGGAGWAAGCAGRGAGRARIEERLASWHREAHGGASVPPGPATVA